MLKLIEREYYYRPTPEDADCEFDPVVWGEEKETVVETLSEALEVMKMFADTWDSVKMTTDCHTVFLNSGSDREDPSRLDYYYVPRHELRIELDEQ